jgi:hypothetical protein
MDTIKVKPWSPDQGDHVLINASDFDPEKHERFDEADESQPATQPKRGRPPKAKEPT